MSVPVKRIEKNSSRTQSLLLTSYCFQDKDSQYKDIVPKLSQDKADKAFVI